MILIAITDAKVEKLGKRWIVTHPVERTLELPRAILAYCDTEAEAKRVRDAINDIPLHLRGVGERVR